MSKPNEQCENQSFTFMKGVKNFVNSKDDPNSILSRARGSSTEVKDSIDKQLETFTTDIEKMKKGELSYAAMRSLYG